jgi:hypothetical protein
MNTYDPKAVIVTWGPITFHGFVEGTHVECERTEDAFTTKSGNDGEVTRSLNNNRTGSVTTRLMQASSTNDLLSAKAAEDELLGTAIYPLQVADLRGRTLEFAQNAWIRKGAKSEFAKEAGDREWIFDCDYLRRTVGGSL